MIGSMVGLLGLAVIELWSLRHRRTPSGTVADLKRTGEGR